MSQTEKNKMFWESHKKKKWPFWITLFICIIGSVLSTLFEGIVYDSRSIYIFLVCVAPWVIILGIAHYKYEKFQCPECGRQFYSLMDIFFKNSEVCQNCGLKKYEQKG